MAFNVSLVVHMVPPTGHVHPVPAIDTRINPAGTISLMLTVPLVAAIGLTLLTVAV